MTIHRLKEIREFKDLTQKQVAQILKVSQQQYNKYELGINVIPLEKLDILADYYETSLDYLAGRTTEFKPYKR